jgi:tripartite-type tricarboxylate transporter receptor subunit TctC
MPKPQPGNRDAALASRHCCVGAWARKAWLAVVAALFTPLATLAAWEPSEPVEIIVPAGTGGGADQMARLIQSLIVKHKLMKQPVQVSNLSGNSGAEGLLAVKAARGDPHKLLVTLSNLFTTPLATGTAFNWRDITPVAMMALDPFVLWVPADSPIANAKDAAEAIHQQPALSLKLGGTGAKQEDQLISVLLETAANGRLSYVPLKGGGDVAKALVEHQVNFTVNNPIEAEAHWRAGKLRPLCVFDGMPLPYAAKLSHGSSWSAIPTCMSAGIPVQYLMLRGIFTTPGATADQVAYYNQLLQRVRELPEWQDYMARGALKPSTLSGPEFVAWLDRAENFHKVLMREARLTAR